MGRAAAKASGAPLAITVMVPAAAALAPPETGASRYSSPIACASAANARASAGAMVAETTSTPPRATRGAQPSGPKIAARACAAFTVSTSTPSVPAGMSEARDTA